MFDSYRGLPKEALYLIYAMILPFVAFGMLFTDLSYFLTNVQGLPDVTMGLIVTVMGLSTFVASIPIGIVADRYGRKRVLIIGNIVASIALAVFALTDNPAILLTAAVLEGISEGAFSAGVGALLAEKCDATRRNTVFSLFGFVESMSLGIGSSAIYLVEVFQIFSFTEQASHILLYVLLAVLSLSSTLLMLKISESKCLHKKSLGKSRWRITGLLPQKSRKVLLRYVIAGATIAFGAGLVVPLMTRWMYLQYNVSDTISGLLLAGTSWVIAVATLAAPYLAKKLGLVKAVVITQATSTLFMLATPLSPNYIAASAVYTVRAFLMNMSTPLEQSMIMGLVAEDERGAASGISTALWRLPNALSSSLGAWLMGLGLLSAPFFLATAFYTVSISLFWTFFRRIRMPEETSKIKPELNS